ncbi:MAG: ribonuclease III [Rhodothermales bacterium]|nr:ribonuclease III [Rhodothermales bacterium]MBO6779034.1 ribonuclease III [Rhodothermales bacterium]
MSWLGRIWSWIRRNGDVEPAHGITPESVTAVTGLPVGDLSLYVQAMRHRSLLRGRPGSAIESNERLEYLGDAVLGFVTAEYLYAEYPEEAEGFLTRLRSKLVNGKALAARARTLGLDHLIMVSDNLRQQGQTQKFTSIMADAFEALIGAIYLDQGTDAARAFIMRTMLEPLDLDALMLREDNHKSLLLEFAQARGWPQPVYQLQDATGPSHKRHFTVGVRVQGETAGTGEGASKKQAEQRAAAEALKVLREADAEAD